MFFNKKKKIKDQNTYLDKVASLLIHAAKIDENYSDKEKKIIKESLVEMGANVDNIDNIIIEAEKRERDSNQILDFTREIKRAGN